MRDAGAGPPPVSLSLVPLILLVGLLSLSYLLFGDTASQGPNQVALLACALVAGGLAWYRGQPWAGIRQAAIDGVGTGIGAIGILLAVGALIGTWALGGTITAMVYYGLKILSPHYFYATTAIICAAVALSIGSSWTVAGTIGIGLMGIAGSMNLSLEITAGAIISGAYFGDKASPLSDTANLAAAAAGSDIFNHIRESLWTSVPALLLAVVGFWLLGSPGEFDASAMLAAIRAHVDVSPWNFAPLVLVLALAVLRVSPVATIFAGALAGGLLAVLHEPGRVIAFAADANLATPLALAKGVWAALATGYRTATGDAALDQLMTRGGMSSMMVTIWLIMTALAFGAVVEHAGFLSRLIDPVVRHVRSVGGLVAALVVTCVGANIVTSDQYIAVVLPGRLFRPIFLKRGLQPVLLSRVLGDSATVTSPLVPWNSCGAYMAAALGVATVGYAAFCFFNLLNPILTVLFSVAGLRVLRSEPGQADDRP
ncbi:MAG: Na+/H+ antiporter NhaC family protein [Dongiaceae bacterium]